MKRTIPIILILITIGFWVKAQDIPFHKKSFPDKKKELKEILKKLSEGNKYFESGMKQCEQEVLLNTPLITYCDIALQDYKQALPYLKEAQQFNPNNALNNFRIGICLFYESKYPEAIPFLEKAYQLNSSVDTYLQYYLALAYHLSEKLDKAILAYNKQLDNLPTKDPVLYNKMVAPIKKKIAECNYGIELMKNPVRVFIDNLGSVINTTFEEYNPIVSADESVLMFTARRDNSTGGEISPVDNMYMEDIYMSTKTDGKWNAAIPFDKTINSKDHDALAGMSLDGEKFFIYRGSVDGGNLFLCELEGLEWTKPKELPSEINTKYHEASACFSPDMQRIFFISNKPNGQGGHDIYYSEKGKKDKWQEAVNIGPKINTIYDEAGVFMHPDGKTIYFSSKGHNSMGGYDIFKVTHIDGVWGEPVNMGYPINTPGDDVFFSINASGTRGYYSSTDINGQGKQDLMVIHFLGPEKPLILNTEDQLFSLVAKPVSESITEMMEEISTVKLTLLKGNVFDDSTAKPLEAQILLIDNTTNQEIASFKSNFATGKFMVSLPSGKNYGLAVKANGYLFHSENFDIHYKEGYQEVYKEIRLKKVEIGNTIILKNIFFDNDKATLKNTSLAELATLATLLIENPTLKIEIAGHTDNNGTDSYNQKLSDDRAKAVVDYLTKEKGISVDRLVSKGYGETKPIDTNETEEGRQQNRRTEFKILSK